MPNLPFLALVLAAGPLKANEPVKLELRELKTNGSGCPIQNAPPTSTFDGQWLKLEFSKPNTFQVQKGPQSRPQASRRNCVLTIELKVPVGFRYAMTQSISSGRLGLQGQDLLDYDISVFRQGSGRTVSLTHEEKAAASGIWQLDRPVPDADRIWSPCGSEQALSVNAQLRISRQADKKGDATSEATLDKLAVRLESEKC